LLDSNPLRALSRDQSAQLAAARDDGHRASAADEQGTHLFRVVRVVQDRQYAPICEFATEQVGPGRNVGRHLSIRYAQRAEERLQRGCRRKRRARTEAAQVEVELAVGKQMRRAVRPMNRQGRLAHAPSTVYDDDFRRASAAGRLSARSIQLA
jgi:hypothetical protein